MSDSVVFEYLYRDASNYKVHGSVLLSGDLTQINIHRFKDFLINKECFIPERVGIPALQHELWEYDDGPTEDDHEFHEFVGFRVASEDEIDTASDIESLDHFIHKFEMIKNHWCI